jgi:uncharacterized protein YgbK (DUF1537 family)
VDQLGIVADDLTGALDTGLQFSKWGLQTLVVLTGDVLHAAEVAVISTDSRAETTAEAHRRATRAAHRLQRRSVYKKIDSTLRGNIGAEVDGVLDGLGLERALVAPAFPTAGRTTLNGYHRVDGIPLAESAFAHDPVWPATESHVPTMLSRQTSRTVEHLSLSIVAKGEQEVIEWLKREHAEIVVADAVEFEHLQTLAGAMMNLRQAWLPCGSAGLAQAWLHALRLPRRAQAPHFWPVNLRPVLVVAGSRHPVTARQLQTALAEARVYILDVSAEDKGQMELLLRAVSKLREGDNVALSTTFSPYQRGQEEATAQLLGCLTASVLARVAVAGLVLTGGDIAHAVCRTVGARALQLIGEVQPGVPAATLVGGDWNGCRLVTKAGGFGDDRAIVHGVDFIQGGEL